ncbi:MAG: hypothetical protein SCK70_09320, partial [bacterium]|nr:hypothetical protein [bacterium]
MNQLTEYVISFKPKSPLITQLQSDTIFGHVAWAIRYLWGEDQLIPFLDAFKEGNDAPFLVSDGFPHGKLPKPFVKALPLKKINAIIDEVVAELNVPIDIKHRTQIIKALKKQNLLDIDTFKKIQDNITAENVVRESARALDWNELLSPTRRKARRVQKMAVMHNTVNRIYNTVTEGLFQQTEHFFQSDFSFDVHLKTSYFDLHQLTQIFDLIGTTGFGKDKSTGKGKFEIQVIKGSKLPSVASPNGFMVLSH